MGRELKVQLVNIRGNENTKDNPSLSPELLASCGARYSRTDEGFDTIYSKVDPNNEQKSIESIFRMVDYGHASIGGMAPVAMFIDGLSIYAAYTIFALCPEGDGQETSTRYMEFKEGGYLSYSEMMQTTSSKLPFTEDYYNNFIKESGEFYNTAKVFWSGIFEKYPHLSGIPTDLLESAEEKDLKKVERMKVNYVFDRSRNFIPFTAKTNLFLVQSARSWVSLVNYLISSPLKEFTVLGEMIRGNLQLITPNLVRHARYSQPHADYWKDTLGVNVSEAKSLLEGKDLKYINTDDSYLEISTPDPMDEVESTYPHVNRYSPFNDQIRRSSARFGWAEVGFAEIRDLNRHRTGNKYCPQVPIGFSLPLNQIPDGMDFEEFRHIVEIRDKFRQYSSVETLLEGHPEYVYLLSLGTTFPFEHVTTLDKLIYEIELRTGVGTHFAYAAKLRQTARLLFEVLPSLTDVVQIGTSEPE